MYPKSPTLTEVEMLKRGYTWYGMWTCQYWKVAYRYPTPRMIMEWKTLANRRLREKDEYEKSIREIVGETVKEK